MQQAIAEKYSALHDRIADEGLYACPYLEYGKEMVRYLSLFGLFVYFLTKAWYITSALFLGLFWVCHFPPSLQVMQLTRINSIKSCSRLTMLAIEPSRKSSL